MTRLAPTPATLALLAAAAMALTTALPTVAGAQERRDRHAEIISVVGTGTSTATPDIARLSLGATAQARTAREALDASSEAAAAILAELSARGVEERDIRTTRLDLSPVYSRRVNQDQPPRIEGYRASNILSVTVRDLDGLGGLLDAMAGAGATNMGGISFALSDPEAAMDEARRAAVADARRRAALYAEAAEVTLGPVLQIRERGAQGPRPMARMAMAAEADSGSVPIAAGESTLRASIHVTFAIE